MSYPKLGSVPQSTAAKVVSEKVLKTRQRVWQSCCPAPSAVFKEWRWLTRGGVIADGTIGRVAESAVCAEKPEREGVQALPSPSPLAGAMVQRPWTWIRIIRKAVGFNGTGAPRCSPSGCRARCSCTEGSACIRHPWRCSGLDDNTIPADVAERYSRCFARAAQAAATMRGKSYSLWADVHGYRWLHRQPGSSQEYLGMRNESIDLMETIRREGRKASTTRGVRESHGNGQKIRKSSPVTICQKRPRRARAEGRRLEFIVKMTPHHARPDDREIQSSKEMGFKEESPVGQRHAAGFQGQRQWTDFHPNGDFQRACSPPVSTGTASARPMYAQQRTMPATAWRMFSAVGHQRRDVPYIRNLLEPEAVNVSVRQRAQELQRRIHPQLQPRCNWCHEPDATQPIKEPWIDPRTS